MNPHCAVFVATSLDGFIARPDGAIDWLEQANRSVPAGEDCGYADFMSRIDALVVGRKTFEKALSFPEWPYAGKSVVVLSRTLQALPSHLPPTVRLRSGSPREVVDALAAEGLGRLYIDGGAVVQDFLRAGLIDEITVTVVPLLLGSGLPLFSGDANAVPLALASCRAYPFGFVQSKYRVDPSGLP